MATSPVETHEERTKRERQRVLFDDVATLYDATRQSYPIEIVERMLATAGLEAGDSVLEIGCGTGQLTRQLAGRDLEVIAIDLGAAMIAAANRSIPDPTVTFRVAAFEDFEPACSYQLVVSATAFHWLDPDVAWAKVARLLNPTGWLAILTTGEKYDEPLRSAVHQLWIDHSPEKIEWTPEPPWAEPLRQSQFFGDVVEMTHEKHLWIPAQTVLGVECTRATYLDYDQSTRQSFAAELRAVLNTTPMVNLLQETFLAMAPVTKRL